MQPPVRTRTPAAGPPNAASSSRLLPTPASPPTRTTPASPAAVRARAARSRASSLLPADEDGADDVHRHAQMLARRTASEVPQDRLCSANGAPPERGPRRRGSEVADRAGTHPPPDPEAPASAQLLFQRRTGADQPKEIEMNEYEVLCKGTVIIGSLQSAPTAVRS